MKVPVATAWQLPAVNGVRFSGPAPTPPPPPPASGFTPESGFFVSGDLIDGGTITISKTGGGFGATGPNIVIYEDFSNATSGVSLGAGAGTDPLNLNSAPPVGSWGTQGNRFFGLIDATRAVASSRSLRVGDGASDPRYSELTFTASQHWFMTYWLYQEVDSSTIQGGASKYTWVLEDSSAWRGDGRYDLCHPTIVAPGRAIVGGNDGNRITSNSLPTIAANTWYRYAAWEYDNGASPMGFMYQMCRPGVEQFYTSETLNGNALMYWQSTMSGTVQQVNFPGNGALMRWYDCIYFATGEGCAARVEIGDSPTYTSCTELAIATVTAWGDGEVTATVRQQGFPTLAGKSMFVVLADNTPQYIGSFS